MSESEHKAEWPEARGFIPRDFELIQDLWDQVRTARLSELYYGQRLHRLSNVNFWISLLIAAFSSGSGIAGWALWGESLGKAVWAILASAAAVLGIARPFLNFDQKVEKATRQQNLYRTVLSDLHNLVFDIRQTNFVSSEQYRRYLRAVDIMRLANDADDPIQSIRQLEKLQRRVLREMPAERLWVPIIRSEVNPA